MKEFSFGLVPDIHLGRKKLILNWWDRLLPRSPEEVVGEEIEQRLLYLIEKINSSSEIEFLILVGDLTDSMEDGQARKVRKILRELRMPRVLLLGNHDVWPYKRAASGKVLWNAKKPLSFGDFKERFHEEFAISSRFFENWEEQGSEFGNFTFIYKDIRFIIVDNVNRRKSPFGLPGAVGWSRLYPESKNWLREQLSQKEERKIVISHAPLKRTLLKAFPGSKKIVHIAGHVHKESIRKSNEITIFTTGALYLKPVANVVKVLSDDIQFDSVRIP